MQRFKQKVKHRETGTFIALLVALISFLTLTVNVYADVPGRTPPGGAVPNPGTQQQELTNITAPAEWNVFEFVVTCGACHAGTQDQHVGHFGNWAGGNMASAARDPIFRANQIGVNDTIKAVTGADGAGNVCFRCHSPNGWLSGRFDPSLGGKGDGSNMIQSILASTDGEGIMCETCHRAVGGVTYQRADVKNVTDATGASVLDKVWNLLAGLFDWQHAGNAPKDQTGTPTLAAGNPYGDTTLQFLDGMTYVGKYSGMTDVYFSDLPIPNTPYTGQIYAVYPDSWVADGNPVNAVPTGQPDTNSAGQTLAYNLDGTLPPLFELPISTPSGSTGSPVFAAQAFSIEHPTVGGAGRGGKFPFINGAAAPRTNLGPVLTPGPGGSTSPNEFIRTSEFCGSCHDLTVPVLNHGMPEQRTYSEWKYSSFAQSAHVPADPLGKRTTAGPERCQDCHMPTLKHEYTDLDNGSYNADPFLVGGFPYGKNRTAQGGTAIHKLTGSNRDLPMMMKVLYPEVDLEVIGAPTGKDPRVFPGMLSDRSPMWDRAKQNTEITLRDGVDVQISQAPTEVVGSPGVYELKVKVLNKSGHRIPSGYPDGRRFWLSVQAKDATGAPVYVSGVYDDATATLKTTTADAFKRSLGNVIDATVTGGNAVQVYERVTGLCTSTDSTKNSTILGAPFVYPEPSVAVGAPLASCADSSSLLNNFILFDNRIPPKGLNYAAASQAGVKFWNYDAASKVPTEEASRYSAAQLAGGYDEVTYRFTATAGQTLSASAELYWQTHSRDFVEHLRTQDSSTVRPEGPPNPFNVNYPNVPNYLSDSINGQPLSSYTALDGSALKDNWGGVAYAAWLATGKGAPFLVDRDDTTVTAAPAAPTLTVSALTAADPGYIDPVSLAPNVFAAKFSWNSVAGADGYTIWIRYGKDTTGATADWDRLVTVGKDVTSHIENVLGDASTNSPGKTYGFKVVAFNGKGEAASPVVPHTVATALPAAPTGLTASNAAPGSTEAQITLNWTDNATNEAGFEIWRSGPTSVNGVAVVYNGLPPVSIVGGAQFNAANGGIPSLTDGPLTAGAPTTGPNTYVDIDADLLPNACYDYKVRAVTNNVDVSTWAVAPSAGCTVGVVNRSINLSGIATSGTRVALTWTSNVADATSFTVKRNGANIGTVAKTAATSYLYADTTAQPGTLYTYLVEATGSDPLVTASVAVTTPDVPVAPSAVTTVPTTTQITVGWTDNSGNEDGFILERSDNGGIYQQIPAVGSFLAPNTVSYLDTAVLQNVTYQYRVKATHLVNGDSNYAYGTPVKLLALPLAPTGLQFTASTVNSVTLGWTDNATNEINYKVEWSADGITWNLASATLAINAQSYTVTGLPAANTTYQFRVSALNAAGPSGFANGSFATDAAAATALTFVTPAQQTQVGLNWTNGNPNNPTVAVTSIPAGTIVPIPVIGNSATATGLTAATSYAFTVSVTGLNGKTATTSATSTTASSVVLAAPTNLLATVNGTSVALTWGDASTGETGYVVQRATVSITNAGVVTQGAFATITGGNRPANAVNVTNTNVANGIYVYRVYAVNGATIGPIATTAAVYRNDAMSTPGQPATSSAANRTVSSINVRNWAASTPATNAITGYVVERCDSGISYTGATPNGLLQLGASLACAFGTWTPVITTTGGSAGVSYNNTGLTGKRLYGYRIKATNTLTNTTTNASTSRILWTN